MNINITFRQMKSSDAIKDHINQRMAKLEKYKDKATEAHVVLSTEKYLHNAEVVFSAKAFQVTAKSSTNDMYASIDDVVTKLEKNIKKHHAKKAKLKTHPKI
ncbi:MAG: ribosome-associated translation inhibitor RaiA [Bdellovibrionales bacterium]|nr:ribosome-associated translation inhibitor RaiA [Bdellovibrionales bacterium]